MKFKEKRKIKVNFDFRNKHFQNNNSSNIIKGNQMKREIKWRGELNERESNERENLSEKNY